MPTSIELLEHESNLTVLPADGSLVVEEDVEVISALVSNNNLLVVRDETTNIIIENLETEVVEITAAENVGLFINDLSFSLIAEDLISSKLELINQETVLQFSDTITSILSVAEQGPAGTNDANFVFTQIVATDLWNITHGLGKRPSVTIVDSGDNVVVGDVEYIDDNQLMVSFTTSFGGFAYLN